MGKTHAEAIQTIKSLMAASTVRMELIQGDESEENGGLMPDWHKWITEYESGHQRYACVWVWVCDCVCVGAWVDLG